LTDLLLRLLILVGLFLRAAFFVLSFLGLLTLLRVCVFGLVLDFSRLLLFFFLEGIAEVYHQKGKPMQASPDLFHGVLNW
jgi:hypothetical protein